MCRACKAGAGSTRGRAGAPHTAGALRCPRPGDPVVWGQILLSAARTSTLVAPRPAGVTVGLHLHVFVLRVVTRGHGVGTEVFTPCVGLEPVPRLSWEPPPKPGGAASIALAQKCSPEFGLEFTWRTAVLAARGGCSGREVPARACCPRQWGDTAAVTPRAGQGREEGWKAFSRLIH